MYGRRQEWVRLWIVRRADIQELDDPDLLQPPLDRSFKKPGGYVMRDKLADARGRAGASRRPGTDEPGPSGRDDLPAATRNALALLLLAMADDEFVIGFRTPNGPGSPRSSRRTWR